MISIIVCSIDKRAYDVFEENVKATIGLQFELIKIDNSANKYSICSAYNEGLDRAKFDYVCFSHEDVFIHTPEWGKKVIEIFDSNPKLGLLGIAGSTYKAFAPSGWGIIPQLRYVNLIQKYKVFDLETKHDYQNPKNERLSRVVCIDGVWMCAHKEVALANRFDESTFNGFHCYDLDFCLNVFRKHEVAVTFDILLEHYSEGRNDQGWISETMKLHKKWWRALPINIDIIDQNIIQKSELNAIEYFLRVMEIHHSSVLDKLRMLIYNNRNEQIKREVLNNIKIRVVKIFLKEKFTKFKLLKLMTKRI